MMCFFYFTENLKTTHRDQGFAFDYSFDGVEDRTQIPLDKIYFSTPSDFYNQVENLKKQLGDKEILFAMDPQIITSLPGFPKNIAHGNLQEKLEQFKGQKEVKIAILNAMSNAIGDHLIGMQAFDYWHRKVCELLPGSQVTITFFQLNPYKLAPITKQWIVEHLYMLPSKVNKLMEQDAYIDLGTLLMQEGFDTQHMIDFFFKALSIDPQSVPSEYKRIHYHISVESLSNAKRIMKIIKSKGRPILLFHHTSTAPIREIDAARSRKIVSEIIHKSNYFVISADGLDYQNKRFMDVKIHSNSLDDFASIISQVDGIITVDTSTYHFADAFNIPTVVLFSTIDPELRIKYYPRIKGIMYENPDGKLYGKHKASKDKDEMKQELEYLGKMWDNVNIEDILNKLKEIS